MYEVTNKTENTSYVCKQTGIIVNGTVTKDVISGDIQYVNGTCYRPNEQGEIGENFGNFNGYLRDGELKYALSEMNRKDSNLVWGAIDEIESNILPANEE
jgi:hypothetical protein